MPINDADDIQFFIKLIKEGRKIQYNYLLECDKIKRVWIVINLFY